MLGPFIVLDFETNGKGLGAGGRATEVAAVLVRDGRLAGQFQSLMNSGQGITPFVQNLTGISNKMIAKAPGSAQVMRQLAEVISSVGPVPLVAHNAAFDRQVLADELARIGLQLERPWLCSMRVARRVYPDAPNHKLGGLVSYAGVPMRGSYHRALADAVATARLLVQMASYLRQRYGGLPVTLEVLQRLAGMPAAKAPGYLQGLAAAA